MAWKFASRVGILHAHNGKEAAICLCKWNVSCMQYLLVDVRQVNFASIVSSSTYQVFVEILQPKGNIYVWWQSLVS